MPYHSTCMYSLPCNLLEWAEGIQLPPPPEGYAHTQTHLMYKLLMNLTDCLIIIITCTYHYNVAAQPFRLHSHFQGIHGNHRTPAQQGIYTVHSFRMFHEQENSTTTNIGRIQYTNLCSSCQYGTYWEAQQPKYDACTCTSITHIFSNSKPKVGNN